MPSINVAIMLAPALFCVAAGLAAAFVVMIQMDAARSPFSKIVVDAVRVFAAQPFLLILPAAMLAVCAASASLLFELPRWVDFIGRRPIANVPALAFAAWFALPAAAAMLGSLGLAGVNALLADCFMERSEGRPAPVLKALGRVLKRMPSLLAFTFLWLGLLLLATLIRMELEKSASRGAGGSLAALMIEFAGFALETGIVMAAYLMLVVMLREDIGPVAAMRRTLLIVQREYGETLRELVQLLLLDKAVMFIIIGAGLSGTAAGFAVWERMPSPKTLADLEFPAIGLTIAAALCAGAGYYVIIQTLQLLLACAVFMYVHDGVMISGFEAADFEDVLCLKAGALPPGVTAGRAAPRR